MAPHQRGRGHETALEKGGRYIGAVRPEHEGAVTGRPYLAVQGNVQRKERRAQTEESGESRCAAGVCRTYESKTRRRAATRQLGIRNKVRWMARPCAQGWKSG